MAKRTQTLIAIIVAVLMLASLFILASCVEKEQEHDCVDINEDNTCDTCGNTLAKLLYTLKEDNTYEVSGYEGTPTKVVIPATYNGKPVTSIGDDAFFVCTSLTSVTIPNSVTSIGERSFDLCYSLTSVTIGNSVTSIGDDAFAGCTSLTSITIPNSVTSIGDDAFASCTSLTSITIPNSVTSIGDDAFWHCNALVSITIPNSVTSIGRAAFRYCYSLTSVTIGNSVTSIGDDAFEGCDKLIEVYNLSSLNIEKGSDNNGYVGYYAKDIYTSLNTPSKVSTDSNGYIIYTDGEEKILIGYVGNETAPNTPRRLMFSLVTLSP